MLRRFEKCILHIGTEKTGTTTLQAVLAVNRPSLAEHGFYVPVSLSPYQAIANHERLTTFSLRPGKIGDDLRRSAGLKSVEDVQPHRIEVRQALLSEISRAHSVPRTLLLSNEHCHSRLTAIDELETLRSFISEFAETVQVIVYLRSQHELAISLYNQALRAGYHDINMLPDFSNEERRWVERRYFDYWDLLSRWSAVFGRSNVCPYIFDINHLKNGSIVDDFFQVIGLVNECLVRPKDRNKSLSARVQPALNAWNRYTKSGHLNAAPKIRARLVAALERLSKDQGAHPTRSAVLAFYEQFSQSNELVRREYFPGQTALFEVDLSDYSKNSGEPVAEVESLLDVLSAILADDAVLKI